MHIKTLLVQFACLIWIDKVTILCKRSLYDSSLICDQFTEAFFNQIKVTILCKRSLYDSSLISDQFTEAFFNQIKSLLRKTLLQATQK